MLTLRAAARLLACADSQEALRAIAPQLGFLTPPVGVPVSTRRKLGLHGLIRRGELFEGPGPLRLFTAQLAPPDDLANGMDFRERSRQVALTLARNAPQRHWCLCIIDHQGLHLSIITVGEGSSALQVAGLRVDRRRVLDSDADTFRALMAAVGDDPHVRHARFTDILTRDALSQRFYRALEREVGCLAHSLAPAARIHIHARTSASVTLAQRRELALLCVSRCLFLGFLEAKGWLDDRRDFLLSHTIRTLESGGALHHRLLNPLFFGTLNTPHRSRAGTARLFGRVPFLNGGLFSPTALERRVRSLHFADDALTSLIAGLLDRYRFTARENSSSWSEAAVDPEMLGRAFESLMAADERRRAGVYYTPPQLVDTAISEALSALLPDIPLATLDDPADTPLPLQCALAVIQRLPTVRILDPACGSGAFLVRILERCDSLLHRAGDQRSSHERRRTLLTRSIFGVDRDPMAVWLCELRLWLSVVIECNQSDMSRISPLPNLDHNIRTGDSLTGGAFTFTPTGGRSLARLRSRYSRATGKRKLTIASALDREERKCSLAEINSRIVALRDQRKQLLGALRGCDLFGKRIRATRADTDRLDALRSSCRELAAQRQRMMLGGALPFRFGAMFADVGAASGFDLVVGNPPWVRPHSMLERDRQWLRNEFRTMRHAGWRAGAVRAGAGAGFAAQADLSVAFVERSIQLLAPGGSLALLVPAKLWKTLSGGGIRRLLRQETVLRALYDWGDAPAQFDAATYPSLIVATRHGPAVTHNAKTTIGTGNVQPPHPSRILPTVNITIVRNETKSFPVGAELLPLDADLDSPWLMLPHAPRTAFQSLSERGIPLAASPIGRPLLGVKCGCNAAFLVHAVEHGDGLATVTSLNADFPRHAVIERHLLRPALRGEYIPDPPLTACPDQRHPDPDLRIIWTHGPDGDPLPALPPATSHWFSQWRSRLVARNDVRQHKPWWALFRTESARSDLPRLVWADIGKQLRSQVIPARSPVVPLNTCYVVRPPSDDDAFALYALLQSNIAIAWLHPLAEPARGGFRRFLGWTVGSLPIPRNWAAAVRILAPLGKQLHEPAMSTASTAENHPTPQMVSTITTLDHAVARAFELDIDNVRPLLDWYSSG